MWPSMPLYALPKMSGLVKNYAGMGMIIRQQHRIKPVLLPEYEGRCIDGKDGTVFAINRRFNLFEL